MAGFRLAEMQGRADVDAVLAETPASLLMEWIAWWAMPYEDTPEEAVKPEDRTPEEAGAYYRHLRTAFGLPPDMDARA
jgi:hypothetical protein